METNLKNLNMPCLTVWQRAFDISAESCIFVGVERENAYGYYKEGRMGKSLGED